MYDNLISCLTTHFQSYLFIIQTALYTNSNNVNYDIYTNSNNVNYDIYTNSSIHEYIYIQIQYDISIGKVQPDHEC